MTERQGIEIDYCPECRGVEEAYAKGEISREEFLQKREDLKRT